MAVTYRIRGCATLRLRDSAESCSPHVARKLSISRHDAAKESNLPSRGLPGPASFEDWMGHQARAAPAVILRGLGPRRGLEACRPCSSAPLTLASSALRRYSASASTEPKRPPGRAGGAVVAEHAVQERQPALVVERAAPRSDEQAQAELEVAEQAALLGQPDLGAVGELARLADVVDDRGGQQQVAGSGAGAAAELLRERRDRDGVLEQAAEVGVVAGARARRAAQRRPQLRVAEQRVEQRAVAGVGDLAGEVLEEAVELVEVAVGDRQEAAPGRRPRPPIGRRARCRSSSTTVWSRKRSTRPRHRGPARRARSGPRAASASRNTRAGIAPLRSRSSSAR